MTVDAISLRGLRKSFGRVEVLRSVDLTVPANSLFGFLGPNGAGKTTTMKILLGLLQPDAGTVEISGIDAIARGVEARRHVGYLPQRPAYPSHLRAREVVELAGRLRGRDVDAAGLLAEVGLVDASDRRVGALSGGQAQRLGLAQALAGDVRLLVLDEPAAGLDPEGRRQMLDLLDGLREKMTLFFSTHLLDDVARLADRIAVLGGGEIKAEGPIDSFVTGDQQVSWQVRLDADDPVAVLDRLATEEWVDEARWTEVDGGVIRATDRTRAEAEMLPALRAAGGVVTELRPTRRSLEDIYLELVDDRRAGDDG